MEEDLENQIRELRARLDANDRVIEALLAWMFVDEPMRFRADTFLGTLKVLTTSTGFPMQLSEEKAVAHAEGMVMMQEALRVILERIEPLVEASVPSDQRRAPPADSR